jgi:hypothetical protein
MIALINKSDLDKLKYVADSVKNNTTWNQFVIEAQMFDIKPWLKDELLNELLTQAATSPESFSTENAFLLAGGVYTYSGRDYSFEGLKTVIIYYAFARYTNRSPFNYTAAGIVQKDSDFSTPVSDKVIQRLETESRLSADALRDETMLFLRRNKTDYPLYRYCQANKRPRCFDVIGD